MIPEETFDSSTETLRELVKGFNHKINDDYAIRHLVLPHGCNAKCVQCIQLRSQVAHHEGPLKHAEANA